MFDHLWIGRDPRNGEFYVSHDSRYNRQYLRATEEQIHSALAQNGWIRYQLPRFDEQEPIRGHYVHSNNWPLDQQAEPLKEYYA